ncbi:pyridoxal-dependent decarboxylase, exosortase A system-associated [Gynuella sp.]|uniref:pyridoxal-dependent decarboxylase, exosortase A system-associated n=1 Tax=Gynuella sp. TaxID=2969146 RepID=UPI003D109FC6
MSQVNKHKTAYEHSAIWPRNEQGEFTLNGQPLSHVVASVGGTPCYLYDRQRIGRRITQLKAMLPERLLLHYAIKANPMPALVCALQPSVQGFDVASSAELRVALDSGMHSEHISFAGPGKQLAELEQAVAAGILIHVESFREVELLADLRKRYPLIRVSVRVNLPFELKASGMKMSGGSKQFGIDAEYVPDMLERIQKYDLSFEGFHMFAGSQNLKSDAIVEVQRKSYELTLEWVQHFGLSLKYLNLGGGFGIPYTVNDTSLDVEPIARQLHDMDAELNVSHPHARLVIELGRYLVGEAGVYVSRIIDKKESRGKNFLIIDGGMHQHLAASGNFGQVIKRNYPLAINARHGDANEIATVVGPLCTPLDQLADNATLHTAQPGDLVVVFQSGAYGRSASPGLFLSHPEVREALV